MACNRSFKHTVVDSLRLLYAIYVFARNVFRSRLEAKPMHGDAAHVIGPNEVLTEAVKLSRRERGWTTETRKPTKKKKKVRGGHFAACQFSRIAASPQSLPPPPLLSFLSSWILSRGGERKAGAKLWKSTGLRVGLPVSWRTVRISAHFKTTVCRATYFCNSSSTAVLV